MTPHEFKKKYQTKKSKYGAISTKTKDGKKFPSKLEARYYERLIEWENCGLVSYFLRQVPFSLPGNIIYRVDFMVVYIEGNTEFVDCKGIDTPVSKLKIAQVEDLYPVKIKIVRKI